MSDAIRKALVDLLKRAELHEIKIEGEFGYCRGREEIERDKDWSDEIYAAREALAQQPAQTIGILRSERDHARTQYDKAIKRIVEIHSLLYPAPVTTADGRTFVFRPKSPDPHEVLQELSDRIRALSDALPPPAPSVPEPLRQAIQGLLDRYGPAENDRYGEGSNRWHIEQVRAALLASGGKASVQWETCESQCTCKVCGTVWTAPEPPR